MTTMGMAANQATDASVARQPAIGNNSGTKGAAAPGRGANTGRAKRVSPIVVQAGAAAPRPAVPLRGGERPTRVTGPGGISRRVRASAERGRVQGPGRAEAD